MRLSSFLGLALLVVPLARGAQDPLALVVMDPLAGQLACACVAGYAQRDYARLASFIEKRTGRPVNLTYSESLTVKADLVIGKHSEVLWDAARAGLKLRSVAMLSDLEGEVNQSGLFVVRARDPVAGIGDLKKHRLLFGPPASQEKHEAGLVALAAFGHHAPQRPQTSSGCSTAAMAVLENEADCAVISSYAMPLLQGCGTISRGELKVIGSTAEVPFITVFASPGVDESVVNSLWSVKQDAALLRSLESRDGFIRFPPVSESNGGWSDWRGPGRSAISTDVPARLPAAPRLLWSRTLTGQGMAGVTASEGRVIVADRDLDGGRDVFRCLDADTGHEYWHVDYPAKGEMDATTAPRAAPVVHEDLVYLLGAFGDLVCAELATGTIRWRKSLTETFGAELPTWGFCSAPLVVDDMLIVNPGAAAASLVALDRRTGDLIWKAPGAFPAYSSFVLARPRGVRQIVGYDAESAGGWDPKSGRRLWRVQPEEPGDFNVATPVMVGDKLLLSTENNGTRLYEFDRLGVLRSLPVARSDALAPDTSSPVVHKGLVFGSASGMTCLSAEDLSLHWQVDKGALADYCSFIAGNGFVLVTSQAGKLSLVRAAPSGPDLVAEWDLFPDVPVSERDVWSHPALVGNRLYVRNLLAVYCFLLD